MTRSRYQELSVFAEALYRREAQKLQPLIAEEARIVQALENLKAQGTGAEADAAMRMIGADASWQKWAETMRAKLLQQQAAVRAQKLPAMDEMRRAFGRKEALLQLDQAEVDAAARTRTRKAEDRLNALTSLARMTLDKTRG